MKIRFHRAARSSPEAIDGLKVPYPPAKRRAPKWRWYLILALVLSPAAYLAFSTLAGALTWSANGSVFLEQYELRAPSAGRIVALHARVGEQVSVAAILAQLENPDLDDAIGAARGRASTLPSNAAHARPLLLEELAVHQRALAAQEERLAATELLVREGAATAAELREARIAADQAMATVLQLRDRIGELTGPGSRSSGGFGSQTELVRLDGQRARLSVRAGADGRVIDVLVSDGEYVAAGQPLVSIGRSSEPSVLAYVSPEISSRLAVGSTATIRFPDGTTATSVVAERPMLTRRMPPDLVNQFGVRPMTVVLHLKTNTAWPASQRIHGLPVSVRFHYGWER
jgi:multidrug resistance efflux pump